jgi:hypothetical protein
VAVIGGTFTYDAAAHPAAGAVTGGGGVPLGAPIFTYNGVPDVPVNGGTYDVIGSYAGDANHHPASGTATITIDKTWPTVTVSGGTHVYDGQAHPATGSVTGVGGVQLGPLTLTYNGSPEPPVNAGGYSVTATSPGDANYHQVVRYTSVQIDRAVPMVTVTGGMFVYDGQPHPAAGSVTGVGGAALGSPAFTYNGAADAPVNAGSYTAVGVFPGDANHAYASGVAAITIAKAVPTLAVTGGTFGYDGQPHPATGSVTGVGGAALGSPAFTYNGSPAAPVDAGSYDVVASYAGSVNYEPVSATETITIAKTPAVTSWTRPAAIVYGTPLGAAQLNASANVAGTFAYSPPAGTVLDAGTSQTLTATFTPADSANYSGASVSTAIDVSKATPVVTVTGGTFVYDGQPHPAAGSVTGVGGAALGSPAFTYNGSAQPPVNAGSYDVVGSYAGSVNYEPASATATISIAKVAAVLSWSQPAAIVYGTPLGAAQLNASANVAGTFAYSPPAGTVLGAGAGHPLTATFTPADAANYTGGPVSTSIAVAPAPLAIRANDTAKPFGAPLPLFTASAAGFVNGDTFASLTGALGFATTATAQSPVGIYPVTASGLGSTNYAVTYLNGTLAVVRGGVTVSVAASPALSGLDQPMTFTATVAAAPPAAGAPGGTVSFFDGATLLGSSALSSGTASLTTAGLTAGVHTIEARYDGDASFDPGTGSSAHTVNDASATPGIGITSNRNPAGVGQTVRLTVNISMAEGPVAGTVQFYDGATLLGSSAIASGIATFTTTSFAAGSHAITVRYLGSASAPPVRSGVFVQAVGSGGWKNRSTSTSLSASPNPSAPGSSVTLTANVTGSSGAPGGRVLFMVNGEVVGSPTGVTVTQVSGSTARATLVLPGLAGGRHKVTATYLGNSTYKGSTATVTQTVQ